MPSPGRPRVQIDPEQVRHLAGIACTIEEIADVLGCSKRTLEKRFHAEIESGRLRCRVSLRRMQFKAAQGGNTTMMIWLGKQLLGQKDKTETSTDDGQMDALIGALEAGRKLMER